VVVFLFLMLMFSLLMLVTVFVIRACYNVSMMCSCVPVTDISLRLFYGYHVLYQIGLKSVL